MTKGVSEEKGKERKKYKESQVLLSYCQSNKFIDRSLSEYAIC
ncbi:hypothetical protein [Dapis sp. BLCC M229]